MLLLVLLFVSAVSGSGVSAQLIDTTFYSNSCPLALPVIRAAVAVAVLQEPRMGASLLRLHFHDCFVNGCDASILLDDTTYFLGEKSAIPNQNSLRGFEVIDNIKTQLEIACPGVVSCADILAVAARDSVVALGGKGWSVSLGRRDSTNASLIAANNNLPLVSFSLTELLDFFSRKGFDATEMVALSGSHTIGQARCVTFRTRIYNDTNRDARFASSLQQNCPLSGGDDNLAPLDYTPNTFDNTYFKKLVTREGLLHSDQELLDDNGGSTYSIVLSYATNPTTFLTDFANAMVKMGNLDLLTYPDGQIRRNCRRIN